ncbi:MAG: glycosyltransferase family 2 protein [Chthonomonas sp.]|nr:glycosyltransferase family 2 protein [Chthonomonas sp.]
MRISVIIPAHNAESYIAKGIESAWAQTVRPDEIVVGVDGSTDQTATVARSLGATALELPKGNGAIARNAAAKAASGDIFFFLDADDWWAPNKIERHLAAWEEMPAASCVLDRTIATFEDGSLAGWTGGRAERGPADWRVFLSHRAWPSGSGFSVRAENYWAVGGFNEKLIRFQDVDFWVRVAAKLGPAFTMGEELTHYLQVQNSVSRSLARLDENLDNMLAEWPFATPNDRRTIRSMAHLIALRQSAWPEALSHAIKAGLPIQNKYFWGSLLRSLKNRRPSK